MIPSKSTINNNLKSSWNPWKIYVKKFIFSKFARLQAYIRQLYYQMNSFTGIFQLHFKPPPLSNFEEPPTHVLNTCEKPCCKQLFSKETCLKSEEICCVDSKEKAAKNEL